MTTKLRGFPSGKKQQKKIIQVYKDLERTLNNSVFYQFLMKSLYENNSKRLKNAIFSKFSRESLLEERASRRRFIGTFMHERSEEARLIREDSRQRWQEMRGKWRGFKVEYPTIYENIERTGINILKSIGILLGASFLVSYLASYLPDLGPIHLDAIVAPAATGFVHWNLSNYAFKERFNDRTFDCLNKWYALSHASYGIVAGLANSMGIGIDNLVIQQLNPSALKNHIQNLGNIVNYYTFPASGLIAIFSAYLKWDFGKMAEKGGNVAKFIGRRIRGTAKFAKKHKEYVGLGILAAGTYLACDYGLQPLLE